MFQCEGFALILEKRVGLIELKVNNTLSLALLLTEGMRCDAQASESYFPLLFSILHGEGAEKGEGIIKLESAGSTLEKLFISSTQVRRQSL